jgi:L-asparaginase / beta-aspartyl-peptidase
MKRNEFVLAVHGGCGVAARESVSDDMNNALRAGLETGLNAGYRVLKGNGAAIDAVTAAVIALEDNPLFNAGRGSEFTIDGKLEMDAAIMDGRDHRAGAVAAILGPRNPVLAARAVMEQSEQVLMVAAGAIEFCRRHGIPMADYDYFHVDARWQELLSERERRSSQSTFKQASPGTVGAVARDCHGNLAAATSTGGMTGKPSGRIGDSPIVGAGTWADNQTCAVSATGVGEFFIRWAVAHEISARIAYRGDSLLSAARSVVTEIGARGGKGGVIAVDPTGAVALPFNTDGMYRGKIGSMGVALTALYAEELRASSR